MILKLIDGGRIDKPLSKSIENMIYSYQMDSLIAINQNTNRNRANHIDIEKERERRRGVCVFV